MAGILELRVSHQVLAQCLVRENVNTHAGQAALRLGRFFLELINPVVFIRVHDAEPAGFLQCDFQDRDGYIGVVFLVIIQHLAVIHLVDMVSGQDQNIFRVQIIEEVNVLGNGICCSLVDIKI